MKKVLAPALLVAVLTPLTAACDPALSPARTDKPRPALSLPNPFVSYGSLQEARLAFGAPFAVPAALPDGFRPVDFAVADTVHGKLAQVLYEHGDAQILYRVVRGVGEGDVEQRVTTFSGDYHAYPQHGVVDAGGTSVRTRGRDGLVFVAYWERDGRTHTLTARQGMTPGQVREAVESVAP